MSQSQGFLSANLAVSVANLRRDFAPWFGVAERFNALAMRVLPAIADAVAVRRPVGAGVSLGALAMLHAHRRFPDAFAGQAFEHFTRADSSRNRGTGGAGLGLAIARGVIEAHGGRIWIESAPGGHVAFELPAA